MKVGRLTAIANLVLYIILVLYINYRVLPLFEGTPYYEGIRIYLLFPLTLLGIVLIATLIYQFRRKDSS
ncbi:MAG TPA: hypothetical protein ENF53_00720 [Thermoprotei archaeon]|nr:hypothetical protein [Thermoprotei archaeon]